MAKHRRAKELIQSFFSKTKESLQRFRVVATSSVEKTDADARQRTQHTGSTWRKESRLRPFQDYSEEIPIARGGCPVRVNGDGRRAIIESYGFN